MSQTLGELIREKRLGRGLSLGQLASAVGTTAGGVRRWERGEEVPASDELAALADYLDIDVVLADRLSVAAMDTIAAEAGADDEPAPADVEDDDVPAEELSPDEAPPVESDESPTELVSSAAGVSLSAVSQPAEPAAAEGNELEAGAGATTVETIADSPPPAPELIPIVEAAPAPSPPPNGPAPDEATPTPIPLRYPESAPPGVAVEIAEPAPNPWNPLRYLYDPDRPWIYWIRAALTVLVLLFLLNLLLDSVGELFDKLGELLDTIEPTEPPEGETPIVEG